MCLIFVIAAVLLGLGTTRAEQHRATRLGNPATRFAPPISTPDDLRARFRDPKLKPDIAAILHQWGWTGNLDDLHRAAQTAEITEAPIAVGTTLPFMSSRESGKPICLRNVLWAGKEPAPAYAFNFASNGRLYRCLTPKACSNFLVEDLGPEPRFALALDCTAPAEVLAGRPVEVCLTLRNIGNVPEAGAAVALTLPEGVTFVRATEGGAAEGQRVTWKTGALEPYGTRQFCAVLAARQPGSLAFSAAAVGAKAAATQSTCATRIQGVPAILLELVDVEDPVEVGGEVTYDVTVTNQGTAPGTNIRLICRLPESQEFSTGIGATLVHHKDRTVTMEPLPVLEPKAAAEWRVVVKAAQAADARFKVELRSDQFTDAIEEDESTQQY